MTAITLNQFGSSQPRIADHLLAKGGASLALDCKLWHGTLESWYEPLPIRDTPEGTNTSFLYGCCWLDFPGCVDIAEGPSNCRKLFATGVKDHPYPVVIEYLDPQNPCDPTVRRLGLPCPDRPLSLVVQPFDPSVSAPKDVQGVTYAYQYANDDGEKSSLSPGTRAQNIREGQPVLLSGWVVPPAEWGVTRVLVYRSVTGHQSGREAGNEADTVWMLVADLPISTVSHVDTKFNDELITSLMEDVANPPPAGLKGIIWVKSMNVLAGFIGNRVYFSENYSYHHWPYYIDLDDNVRALTESNGTIYAATDGFPYAIPGAVDCKNAGCRQPVRLAHSMPMVGQGNRRMASVSIGAVYPSVDGLVLLSGTSEPALISWPRYAPDDWQKLLPESVIPIEVRGRLFVFARGGAFVMALRNGVEGGWQLDDHTELSDTDVTDAFVPRGGDLFIIKQGTIMQWDRGTELRPHRYRSPEIVSPAPVGFSAGHIVFKGGPESVIIKADNRQVYEREFLSGRVFRLPNKVFGARWYLELTGTASVSLLSIATAMRSLGS